MLEDLRQDKDNSYPTHQPPVKVKDKSLNLAILPVLAILAFIIYVCLKCCSCFRQSLKDRREGYDDELDDDRSFEIISEGDTEYNDVDFRSDVYSSISSYASFMKHSNPYDTVNSTRSLQIPRQWDTHNSYRSFLQHHLDSPRQHNSVNSYRSFLRHSVGMRDACTQVESVNYNSENKICGDTGVTEDTDHSSQRSSLYIKNPHRYRPKHIQHRRPQRSVSISDNRVMESGITRNHRLLERTKSVPSRSVKRLWGIREPLMPTQTVRQHKLNVSDLPSNLDIVLPRSTKFNRFKVCKTSDNDCSACIVTGNSENIKQPLCFSDETDPKDNLRIVCGEGINTKTQTDIPYSDEADPTTVFRQDKKNKNDLKDDDEDESYCSDDTDSGVCTDAKLLQ